MQPMFCKQMGKDVHFNGVAAATPTQFLPLFSSYLSMGMRTELPVQDTLQAWMLTTDQQADGWVQLIWMQLILLNFQRLIPPPCIHDRIECLCVLKTALQIQNSHFVLGTPTHILWNESEILLLQTWTSNWWSSEMFKSEQSRFRWDIRKHFLIATKKASSG